MGRIELGFFLLEVFWDGTGWDFIIYDFRVIREGWNMCMGCLLYIW